MGSMVDWRFATIKSYSIRRYSAADERCIAAVSGIEPPLGALKRYLLCFGTSVYLLNVLWGKQRGKVEVYKNNLGLA